MEAERQLTRIDHDYDDIPGTYVFDAERSRRGYGINMFCMSLLRRRRTATNSKPTKQSIWTDTS